MKRVHISVYKGKKLIEDGDAVECAADIWEYKARALITKTNGVRIVATAYDLTGNFASLAVKI